MTPSGRRVVVEVPASSANLGAGFDCLALALEIVNRVEIEAAPSGGTTLSVEGEGSGEIGLDPDNRFLTGLQAAFVAAGAERLVEADWRIAMTNRIPLARGLGSSASATVAGLLAGDVLSGGRLEMGDLLRLATEIEGHPDNASAALLGGLVASSSIDGRVEAVRVSLPGGVRAVLFIPEIRLSTARMRAVLPDRVPRADAVANLGRLAVGLAALGAGRAEGWGLLAGDRLHEPYRAKAYPQLPGLLAAAREAGALGACLSGAGSTIITFADGPGLAGRLEDALALAAAQMDLAGRTMTVGPRDAGAVFRRR